MVSICSGMSANTPGPPEGASRIKAAGAFWDCTTWPRNAESFSTVGKSKARLEGKGRAKNLVLISRGEPDLDAEVRGTSMLATQPPEGWLYSFLQEIFGIWAALLGMAAPIWILGKSHPRAVRSQEAVCAMAEVGASHAF